MVCFWCVREAKSEFFARINLRFSICMQKEISRERLLLKAKGTDNFNLLKPSHFSINCCLKIFRPQLIASTFNEWWQTSISTHLQSMCVCVCRDNFRAFFTFHLVTYEFFFLIHFYTSALSLLHERSLWRKFMAFSKSRSVFTWHFDRRCLY